MLPKDLVGDKQSVLVTDLLVQLDAVSTSVRDVLDIKQDLDIASLLIIHLCRVPKRLPNCNTNRYISSFLDRSLY